MVASMSFAGFFPPAKIFGSAYFDGSAVWDIDIFSAINRCKESGFSDQDIIVDVIMTSSANLKDVQNKNEKSVDLLFRYFEISSYYNAMDGLLRARFAYPNVTFRYVISPTRSIPTSGYPLNMDKNQIEEVFEMGKIDAQNAITNSNSSSLDSMIHYHALKK